MTKSEVALILAKAAAFDARTVGEADIEAWHECIGDLDFTDAMEAVTSHYRHSSDRLMPSHLVIAAEEGIEPWLVP